MLPTRIYAARGGGGAATFLPRTRGFVAFVASQVTKPDASALKTTLSHSHSETLAKVVPWFLEQMPATYFRIFGSGTQRRHLRAIAALLDTELNVSELALTSHAAEGGVDGRGPGSELHTFLSRGGDAATSVASLAEQLARLPAGDELRRVLVFHSADGALRLNIFETGTVADALYTGEDEKQKQALATIKSYAKRVQSGEFVGDLGHVPPMNALSLPGVERFLRRCPASWVCQHDPRLLYRQVMLCQPVSGTEDVAISLEGLHDSGSTRGPETLITIALGNAKPRRSLQGALGVLSMHHLEVERVLVDAIAELPTSAPGLPSSGLTLIRAVVRPLTASASTAPEVDWAQLQADLRRYKWLDDSALTLAAAHPGLGLARAEAAFALGLLSLSFVDHPLLSRGRVLQLLSQPNFRAHVVATADALLNRFDPAGPTPDAEFEAAIDTAEKAASVALGSEESRVLAHALSRCVRTHSLSPSHPSNTPSVSPSLPPSNTLSLSFTPSL